MPDRPATLAPVTTAAFIEMMRAIPAAVTVVAAQDEGQRRGMTATAVCSLSADPPQLLVCINRHSSLRPVIAAAGCFSVNFLTSGQEVVARRFAEAAADHDTRFATGNWRRTRAGPPVLDGALATAVCAVVGESVHDSHAVYVGLVVETVRNAATPLLYHDRGYCGVAPAAGP